MLKNCYASCLLVISLAVHCAVALADEPPKMVVSSSRVEAKLVLEQEPKISIKDLAFSPDSTTLVTAGVLPKQTAGSETVKIRFWNTQTGQMIRELKGDVPKTDAPTRSDAYIDLSKPRFWSNPLIWADPLDEHTLEKNLLLVAYSPDGKMIATSTDTVNVWDAQTGQLLRQFHWGDMSIGLIFTDTVTSIAFSPDNKKLVVGATSGQSKLRVFDVQTGVQTQMLYTNFSSGADGFQPMPVKFSPDGKLIATGGTQVKLWDAAEATSKNMQDRAN